MLTSVLIVPRGSEASTRTRTGANRVYPRWAAAMSVLSCAAWFGLVVGQAELGLVLAQKWLHDPGPLFFRLNRHVVWMVPAADLALFVGVGLVLAALASFRPFKDPRRAYFVYLFLGMLALLLTHRPLHGGACIVLALGLAYRLSRRIGRYDGQFRSMVRRSLPGLGVASAALVGASYLANVVGPRRPTVGAVPAPRGAPNVLLVVLDTVRADRLSAYGYPRPTTPNLERLAARGILFSQRG